MRIGNNQALSAYINNKVHPPPQTTAIALANICRDVTIMSC